MISRVVVILQSFKLVLLSEDWKIFDADFDERSKNLTTLECLGKSVNQCNFENVNLNDSSMKFELNLNEKNSSKIGTAVFENSNLSFIPNEIYQTLSGLTTIHLNNVNIKTLNSGFFMNQRKLTHIQITGSNIAKVAENAFSGLTNLVSLNLANNFYFGEIHENTFKGLENLKNFIFVSNKIEHLNRGFLEILENPGIKLTISGNMIIGNLTSMKALENDLFYQKHEAKFPFYFSNWNEIFAKMPDKKEFEVTTEKQIGKLKKEKSRNLTAGTEIGTQLLVIIISVFTVFIFQILNEKSND